ncbi:MAG: glycosyltransferase [Dechloromonas sp.]|uniref:glycosyltransferase n=1 Tax=Dechloromonas sp. TaxID=1917218 RepID=UPI0027F5F6DA|nr:glycosyltransferase [Dechloromonas sp.]MBT9519358.1 glycosyltransferase [Dechloromonas sp.]
MKLSIAIFGNTNNYPLLMAQGLRLLGHNVRLVLNRKDLLHRPEARYPDWAVAYPDWVVDCSNLSDEDIAFETPAMDQAIHCLTHNVDFVILNDVGPALASYLRTPHAVVLTGSDLAYYANFDSLQTRSSMWDPEFKRSLQGRRYLRLMADLVARQRDGILGAEVVCYGQRGLVPSGDGMIDGIGVSDTRRLMLYFSNTIDLQAQPAAKNSKLTILCGSRIVYRPEHNPALSAMDFKGTDILLKGFALYCQRGGRGELRLPRKGQDLQAAIDIISELDITERIHWLDEMSLAKFYEEMIAADLVCDQFGSSFPGMVTTDAYALGRPVMAKLRPEIFSQRFPEALPGFDAETPEQIADCLMMMEQNRDVLPDMGCKSRAYAEAYLSPESMAKQLLDRCGLCVE